MEAGIDGRRCVQNWVLQKFSAGQNLMLAGAPPLLGLDPLLVLGPGSRTALTLDDVGDPFSGGIVAQYGLEASLEKSD
jgi:hypothetical protein